MMSSLRRAAVHNLRAVHMKLCVGPIVRRAARHRWAALAVALSLSAAPRAHAQPVTSTAPPAEPVPAWSARLDSLITAEMSRTHTPGVQVAVVVDGALAYSRGYGVSDIEAGRPVTEHTLFRIGSVTKMITSAALLQLVAKGDLDLHAPIGQYVPELAERRIANVTTHQLLTHSAGWRDEARAYGRMGESALGEVMREVTDTLLFTEPGAVLSYSNPGYSMAGYVAEQAAGIRFGTLVEQLVLKPVGMTRATFRPLQALTYDASQGHVGAPGRAPTVVRPYTENTAQWAAGFLFTNAAELARFAIALMNGGTLDGARVLAPETVAALTTGHVDVPGGNDRYGYGLVIANVAGERVWQHGGSINGFDAMVTMFPDRKVAVILTDNRGGAPLQGVVDLVVRTVVGLTPPPPPARPAPRVATATERAQLAGRYAQGALQMAFEEQGDSLVFKQGGATFDVRLIGDDLVQLVPPVGPPAMVLVVRDADGRVRFLHQGMRAIARLP